MFAHCKPQNQNLEDDEKKIISLVIDEYTIPLPPPPSTDPNDTLVSIKDADSLKNAKLNIAVYPIMDNEINKIEDGKIPDFFKSLLKYDLPIKTIHEATLLKSTQGHKIVLADTTILSNSKEFKKFNLLFNFSRIWFDKSNFGNERQSKPIIWICPNIMLDQRKRPMDSTSYRTNHYLVMQRIILIFFNLS
ncbi:hypothetical protein FVB32_04740 [Flagellimonas hymeniacidonis]|uniref:Uncharacterized protein n=1 Tax=Flagellimonas hymeniacidonis TaxID=2603628 RepID=A0A5C8V8M7_9FLAO|nr:hypothetical protein [Flagellimonas hymeniacidonis]TXN37600.1 hypothetical protein FVB32_04740 [Flagellimonas hymeniacidonis]